MQSPHFPPTALEYLSWVSFRGWWSGVGTSPSNSDRPLLEQEAANVESRCASEGNQVCRRQGEEAQSSLWEQHLSCYSKLHTPNTMSLQQRQGHQPTSSLPCPQLIYLNTAGSILASNRYQETSAGTRLRTSSSKMLIAPAWTGSSP